MSKQPTTQQDIDEAIRQLSEEVRPLTRRTAELLDSTVRLAKRKVRERQIAEMLEPFRDDTEYESWEEAK